MCGSSPNYDDWRSLPSIKVWEIAALMHGFDPRAGADVVVRDPDDPTSPYGVSPDLSWEIRMLISAVDAGELTTAPAGVAAPNDDTGILRKSLVAWLRLQEGANLTELADALDTPSQTVSLSLPAVVSPPSPTLSEPERRLKALRDLNGDAKWTRYRGNQQWCFKKIKELTAQEKGTKKPRCDEKTIRKDLTEAAEAESMAKRSGIRP